MESTNPKKAEFELLSRISGDLWFAVKKDSYRGTKFLAKEIGHYRPPRFPGEEGRSSDEELAFHDLMFNLNQAPAIAQIFNHENIVSIAGHMRVRPLVKPDPSASPDSDEEDEEPGAGGQTPINDLIVWDFCDASNLSTLLDEHPLEGFDYYLPESLCWHVLTSLIRAVTWLHDGKRQFFDPRIAQALAEDKTRAQEGGDEQDDVVPPQATVWNGVDHDWNPILHRAIEPDNIFFQHPQGLETYGLCKLGNFEHAAVTNHIILPGDGPQAREDLDNPSVALAARRGHTPWRQLREDVDKQPEVFDSQDDRPYTITDELWSIGSVILNMMTGQKPLLICPLGCCHVTTCAAGGCLQDLAVRRGCVCSLGGCAHLPAPSSAFPSSTKPCAHNVPCIPGRPVDPACAQPVVNIDTLLSRARYTWRLRRVVKELLSCDPGSRARVSKVLPYAKRVLEEYRGWREGTEEGMEHRDIEDDMAARWAAEMAERKEKKEKEGRGDV